MFRLIKTAAVALAVFAVTMQFASAAQITGNINLVGDFKPSINGTATQNMALANGIDFLPLGGGTGSFQTLSGNGDLAAYDFLTGGSIKDFKFNPFLPVLTFYSISTGGNTLSFDLASLTVDAQSASFLNLSGSGTIHATGFDATPGTFFFTGQSTNGASRQATFSWSAGTAAIEQEQGVPEPATLGLLGLGLLAVRYARRRAA